MTTVNDEIAMLVSERASGRKLWDVWRKAESEFLVAEKAFTAAQEARHLAWLEWRDYEVAHSQNWPGASRYSLPRAVETLTGSRARAAAAAIEYERWSESGE